MHVVPFRRPRPSLSRFDHGIDDDGRRCSVSHCLNRSRLFGDRDIQSGWIGYCSECNARWYAWELNSRLRACSRGCSHSLLSAFGIGANTALIIRQFLYFCYSNVRRNVLWTHKLRVMHLLWLSCPQHWYMEDTDSEAEEERYVKPTLRTLIEVYLDPQSEFYRQCFGSCLSRKREHFRLLDAVSAYLADPSDMQSTFECPEAQERSWEIFRWCDRKWLWNVGSDECFYVDSPPVTWQRYRYFPASGIVTYWWCSGGRWFIEPKQ